MRGKAGINGTAAMIWELIKAHLSIFIGLSAVSGYHLSGPIDSDRALMVGLLVFCLASGAACLNNIQDRRFDAHFRRTCKRALPSGRIPVMHAGILAIGLITTGLWGLARYFNWQAFVLGTLSLICYNALYTPMKKKTTLAIIPGTVCGMLGPAIGWAAGGEIAITREIISLMVVFGVWQMTHYLLLVFNTRTDIRHTPFPSLAKAFSNIDLRLHILIWSGIYCMAMIYFLWISPLRFTPLSVVLAVIILLTIPIVYLALYGYGRMTKGNSGFYFINLSMLVFMTSYITDALVV